MLVIAYMSVMHRSDKLLLLLLRADTGVIGACTHAAGLTVKFACVCAVSGHQEAAQ